MIIINGKVQAVSVTSSLVDGIPTETAQVIGEAIPCNISGPRRHDNINGDNSYTTAQYEVLVDDTDFYADEVILTNNRSKRLGTFRVQDIQYLDCVDTVKIICERYAD